MLLLHRTFIRLSLLFLLAGIGLGALLQVRDARQPGADPLLALSAALQALGALLFVAAIWRRVRFPRVPRPEAGRP